jgi:opacity protein-like surface antigen
LGKCLLLSTVLVALVGWQSVSADQTEPYQLFNKSHQAGIRLGVWANQGGRPPAEAQYFETNFNNANFYFEGYFGYRLLPIVMLELSLGIVNRGSVTFIENNASNVGHVLVHPLLLQAKLYPLSSLGTRIQPYLTGGGGLYYGRRSVQFTTSGSIYFGLDEQTGTNLNYAFGGGVDWPVGKTIGLEANVRYMSINFSKGLQTVRDYDALVFTIGLKYLYLPKK